MGKKSVNFSRIYRHAGRYFEIIEAIGGHGFAELLKKSKLTKYLKFREKSVFPKFESKIYEYKYYERIRMILEKLGPTFIKFGQILSTRPDLIPPELVYELEKLQDAVPPFQDQKAIGLIEKELKKNINELFSEFDATPIASASISQVYKAVLFDGKKVAVKVQKPDITKTIQVDLEIMLLIAETFDKHIPFIKTYNLPGIIKEFDKSIWKELDFSIEMGNMEKFKSIFHGSKEIYIPACYRNLSTKRIMTMEFIDGVKVSEIDELLNNQISLKTIAKNGVDAILKQIFIHGYFHADLHSGNIMVLPDNVITFLDYGIVGKFTKKSQDILVSILLGVADKDPERTAKSILDISGKQTGVDINSFELQVSDLIDKHFSLSLDKLDLVEVFKDIHKLFSNNNLVMPENFYLLLKTLAMAQAFGIKLDPDINISERIEPFARKLLNRKFNPKLRMREFYNLTNDLWQLLTVLPSEIKDILKILKKGNIKIEIQHNGFDDMLKTHERISNRISFSLVLASIIIGSALVIRTGIPPLWNGIPIIGLAGFVSAVILGFWLLISIMKHGKM